MTDSGRSMHPFRIIEGGAQSPPSWLDLPSRLAARSPFDRSSLIDFRFSQNRLIGLDYIQRRQPVLDAWCLVHGRIPPLPNESKLINQLAGREFTGVRQSHACFRGMMRPVGDDNRGFDVIAYITKPSLFVRYESSLVCPGTIEQVPYDLVFVTYVKLDRSGGIREAGSVKALSGIVTHWQFVEADARDNGLPIGFQERYRRRLW